MLKLQIIVGSTRPTRNADKVMPWVLDRAERSGAFEVEVLDLRDWPLPMFAESLETIGDRRNPTYSEPIVKAWNDKVKEADAYLFVTTEYNHSVPAVLKNAIDSVFLSFAFRNKVAGFVGYSNGAVGGARAVEHLAHIAIEAELVPLRNAVLVGQVATAFDDHHDPKAVELEAMLSVLLEDLAWWGEALQRARAAGELPGGMRRRIAFVNRAEKES